VILIRIFVCTVSVFTEMDLFQYISVVEIIDFGRSLWYDSGH
jgi:hypothetical protein